MWFGPGRSVDNFLWITDDRICHQLQQKNLFGQAADLQMQVLSMPMVTIYQFHIS